MRPITDNTLVLGHTPQPPLITEFAADICPPKIRRKNYGAPN